jgi:hypothetical protein
MDSRSSLGELALQALGNASIEDELRLAFLYTGTLVVVVSAVLSSIPLAWLCRLIT